jgi:hypothetical protein
MAYSNSNASMTPFRVDEATVLAAIILIALGVLGLFHFSVQAHVGKG